MERPTLPTKTKKTGLFGFTASFDTKIDSKTVPDKKQVKLTGQYFSTSSDTITPALKRAARDGPGGRTINKCIRQRAPFRRFSTLHVRDFHRTSTFRRLKAFPFTFWCISFALTRMSRAHEFSRTDTDGISVTSTKLFDTSFALLNAKRYTFSLANKFSIMIPNILRTAPRRRISMGFGGISRTLFDLFAASSLHINNCP